MSGGVLGGRQNIIGGLKMSDFRRFSVWNSSRLVFGLDPQLWRIDPAGRIIFWDAYGDRSHSYGWEIGHITALADGGMDAYFNIQAEHWVTNLNKEYFRRQNIQGFGNIYAQKSCLDKPFQYFGNER